MEWQVNWWLVLATVNLCVFRSKEQPCFWLYILCDKLPGHCKIKGWAENKADSTALAEKILHLAQ